VGVSEAPHTPVLGLAGAEITSVLLFLVIWLTTALVLVFETTKLTDKILSASVSFAGGQNLEMTVISSSIHFVVTKARKLKKQNLNS